MLGDGDRLRLVLDRDVDHAIGHLDRPSAPTSSGEKTPRLPPSIIAGPPMPIDEFLVAITTSQQPRIAGVAGEAAAGVDAHQRRHAAQAPEDVEGHRVEAGHRLHVDVARPATAALGEEDQRNALLLDDLEQPVLLVMVVLALRAGQHRVVVMRHRDPAALRPEQRAVDPADAGDQPVGRRLLDQVLDGAPRALARRSAKAPYSTKLLGSTRSSRFCRAVRWLVLRRRATDIGPLPVERHGAAFEILARGRAGCGRGRSSPRPPRPSPRHRPPRRTAANGLRRSSRPPRPRCAAHSRAPGSGSRAASSWRP